MLLCDRQLGCEGLGLGVWATNDKRQTYPVDKQRLLSSSLSRVNPPPPLPSLLLEPNVNNNSFPFLFCSTYVYTFYLYARIGCHRINQENGRRKHGRGPSWRSKCTSWRRQSPRGPERSLPPFQTAWLRKGSERCGPAPRLPS